MGARAFAYGNDVFLGPGESGGDRELMGHELTHVAQQQGGARWMQAKVEVGDPGSPAEQHADHVGKQVASGAPSKFLLADKGPLAPGQMLKFELLELLRRSIIAAVEQELGAGATDRCPYIARYFDKYNAQPAAATEALLRRWLPETAAAHSARDVVPPVIARVRDAVGVWVKTGSLPPELAAADPAIAMNGLTSAPAQRRSLDRMEAELGPGEPLDAAVAARMTRAINADVSGARIHSGPVAQRMAAEYDATAFAVGKNVVLSSSAPRSGLMADALLAHELAHTAQQSAAAQEPEARKKPIGEEDEAAERDAGLARLGNFAGAIGDVMRTELQLQRCPGNNDMAAKSMNDARYHEIEARLRSLVTQKREVVEGKGQNNMAAIDAEIDQLISELRVDFGIRMEKGQILDDAAGRKEMRVVDGRIVVSPSGKDHYVGERLGFKLEVDHVPPGETLQIDWRWTTQNASRTYKFFSNGPGFKDRTTAQEIELDTPFWGISSNEIEQAGGMEVQANLYVGKAQSPTKLISTGFISMPAKAVGEIKVVGAPERVVKDSYLDLGIGPWTPDFTHHRIDWFVDGDKVATDQLGLHHQFSKLGTHLVRADVYSIRRSFGGGDVTYLKSGTTAVEVLADEGYGDKFLDDLDKSPFRPKPVGLADVVSSGDKTLGEIQHRIDQGGSQRPFWEDRQKAQKERLAKIKELSPDYATQKPLPPDPTKLDPGSYSRPITAALVMSANGGGAQPLTIHLTIHGMDGAWHARLLDTTSRKVMKYDGDGSTPLDAYKNAFETWHSNNEYPTGGHVVYRFAPPGWTGEHSFNTTTTWKKAKEWVDGLIQVGALAFGLLLLSDPDPTLSKLLGAVLMAAVTARSSVAIYERIRDGGDVLSTENILDGVAIVTSFMGVSGGVLRGVGVKAINPTVYRIGNWMVMSAVAADAGTFIYASAEAVASLRAIEADPTLDDGQKAAEMMRIMASLFISGAMLIVSNKELVSKGLKPNDFIKSELTPGMKPELDVGARLDAEYELKKGGQWTKETSKLSNEELLGKVFNQRSRQEIESALLQRMRPEDVKALTAAFGDEGMIALQKQVGERLPHVVAEVGPKPFIDAKNKFGATTAARLAGVVGGKKLPDVVARAENLLLRFDEGGGTGSYRWGGTGNVEAATSGDGARVKKTNDRHSGLRTVEVEGSNGDKIKLSERDRYAEVKIDPAKLTPEESSAVQKLFADHGITDQTVKAKIYEAIENARIREPSLDVASAIKKDVAPMLKEAEAAAKKQSAAGKATTTQDVLAAQGKAPIVPEAQEPAVTQAQAYVAAGILEDPVFQAARTVAEGRDALSQKILMDTGRQRAEASGANGGKVLTKIQFIGDLYVDETSTTRYKSKKSGKEIINTDVAPDVDVAYVIDVGGKLNVEYVGGAKIGKPSASAKALADAKIQNVRNKEAIEAGNKRFKTTTRDGDVVWAEVKKVTALDEGGSKIDVTGKLTMAPAARLETIGAPGMTGFDATMPVADSKTLDKIVEAIWRIGELRK